MTEKNDSEEPDLRDVASLEDFQRTAKITADVGGLIGEEWANDLPGILYAGGLHIEIASEGNYCLTIGNASRLSSDLSDLEAELYAFGIREDYFPDPRSFSKIE